MRSATSAALLLVTACATLPPLRPADPAQAVANEPSAAASAVGGVRVVVRPGAGEGYAGDLDEYFTPVEVAIANDSGHPIQVRPASFSLLTPNGFRYEALSPEDLRHALGPWRGTDYGYGYSFYGAYPVPGPYFPWTGPGLGWWWGTGPHPWWGAVPYYGSGYGIPASALTKGTLDAGGRATVLVVFPVPETELRSLELDASFVDPSGAKVADLRVPFVREGQQPVATRLPATAAPPQQPGAAPQQPGTAAQPPPSWETTPPTRPPAGTPPPPPADQPVGPPVPPPDASSPTP